MIALFVIAVVVILFFYITVGTLTATEGKQKAAVADQDVILAALFDGSETVEFHETFVGLPATVVVTRAAEFGYELAASTASQYGMRTLTLTRVEEVNGGS